MGEGGRNELGPYTRAMNCQAEATHRSSFMQYTSVFHESHPCNHTYGFSYLKEQYINKKIDISYS